MIHIYIYIYTLYIYIYIVLNEEFWKIWLRLLTLIVKAVCTY